MMRALALLLLLANLTYHLWSLQRPLPAGSAPPPEPLPEGAERLRLLSEGPPATPPSPHGGLAAEPAGGGSGAAEAPPRAPRQEEAAAAGPHCERIGPLEPTAAARVVAALRRAGGRADVVPEPPSAGPAAVQLYVPAPTSFAEAREIVRNLGEAGLEAYVMGREEVPGAVSVGLFTEAERARDRRARVEALGYEVAERELGAPAPRVRVAVRLPAPAIERALAGLAPDPEAYPREAVPCGREEMDPVQAPP
jgi:hypothetical protein